MEAGNVSATVLHPRQERAGATDAGGLLSRRRTLGPALGGVPDLIGASIYVV